VDSERVRLRALARERRRRALPVLPLLFAAACAAAGARAAALEATPLLDYLYIEPNAGGSSGGHAAVCLRDVCYHFQQADGGTIRLRREARERLDFDYRVLGNRAIHVSRIAIAPDTEARLHDELDRRLFVQDQHLDRLDELVRDRLLLERLLPGHGRFEDGLASPAPLRVPGSGYFFADERDEPAPWWPEETPRSTALVALGRRVSAAHGVDFLARRAAELRSAITHLPIALAGDEPPKPVADRLESGRPGFAARYDQLLTGFLAVQVLRAAPALRADGVLRSHDAAFRLQPGEVEALRRYSDRLESRLVRLLASARPDWGYPLLIGMARLAAIEESIRSGSLVVLDVFAAGAPSIPASTVASHAGTLALVGEERRADFARLRGAFFGADEPGEARLSMLELAANLFVETGRAVLEHAPLRLPPEHPLPARAALRRDWPAPALSNAVLESAWRRAREREQSYRADLSRLYPYDLLQRNCVTEIFRTMERALVGADADETDRDAVRAASTAGLGGYVDWRHGIDFIPVVSARAVADAYRVVETEERPSYRQIALRRMYERENALGVALRESNVLTARAYERNEHDPVFLFFTDDVFLRRPFYGAANVAVGLAATLAGAVLSPFDRGKTLRSALSGTLFSLPELALVNIRKGSYVFAPRRWGKAEGLQNAESRIEE
jgi:hypothetical protein